MAIEKRFKITLELKATIGGLNAGKGEYNLAEIKKIEEFVRLFASNHTAVEGLYKSYFIDHFIPGDHKDIEILKQLFEYTGDFAEIFVPTAEESSDGVKDFIERLYNTEARKKSAVKWQETYRELLENQFQPPEITGAAFTLIENENGRPK